MSSLIHKQRKFLSAQAEAQIERWAVRFMAILTAAMGVINLLSAVTPALADRLILLSKILPMEVRYGSRLASALAGFALLVLAFGLWRRKRAAWMLTVIALIVSILTHLLKGLDVEEAAVAGGLLLLLILLRNSFHAHSDPPSWRQGLLVLAGSFLFTLAYGTIGFYLLDRHFHVDFSLPAALRQTLMMFAAFDNSGLEPLTGHGRYFAFSIYGIALATFLYALRMLLRPVLVREPATAVERQRAAAIVQNYGRTALARAALFEDKSYFFTSGGSVIAYAARGRGAMALGDPIGPKEDAAAAIVAFRDFCRRNDWTPAFLEILPDSLEAYHQAGFQTFCIGHEAIVALESYTLQGSENKNVRNAVNKMIRSGYRFQVHLPPVPDHLLHALRWISDAWLTAQHGSEMRFSLGWFDEDYLRNGPVAVVYGPDDQPVAFANLVSEYQKNEITIDLMRRYPKAASGVMELLFASMLQWAQEQGYATFSLGLSGLAGVGERPTDPQTEKVLKAIGEALNRFYHFKGLHEFKEKFHPRWEPRYLAYLGVANLPQVMITLVRVHSGDDFWWRYLAKR